MLKGHNRHNLRLNTMPADMQTKKKTVSFQTDAPLAFDCTSSGDFPLLQQEIKELVIMEDNYISGSVCLCCCGSLLFILCCYKIQDGCR